MYYVCIYKYCILNLKYIIDSVQRYKFFCQYKKSSNNDNKRIDEYKNHRKILIY